METTIEELKQTLNQTLNQNSLIITGILTRLNNIEKHASSGPMSHTVSPAGSHTVSPAGSPPVSPAGSHTVSPADSPTVSPDGSRMLTFWNTQVPNPQPAHANREHPTHDAAAPIHLHAAPIHPHAAPILTHAAQILTPAAQILHPRGQRSEHGYGKLPPREHPPLIFNEEQVYHPAATHQGGLQAATPTIHPVVAQAQLAHRGGAQPQLVHHSGAPVGPSSKTGVLRKFRWRKDS